jgi:hypothetical protein
VLVGKDQDCHERRREIEKLLYREFGIEQFRFRLYRPV